MSGNPVSAQFTRPMARPGSGLDLDEATIDRAVAAQGAPVRVYPEPPANSDAAPEAPVGEDSLADPAKPARKPREVTEAKPTPRNKWTRVTVELPDYLVEEMKLRAVKDRVSLRHLVMIALRTRNFRILDADMVTDARKGNGRKR